MWYIGLSEYLRTHYWPDENAFEFDARLSQLFVEVTVHAHRGVTRGGDAAGQRCIRGRACPV